MQLNTNWLCRELRLESPTAEEIAALEKAFEPEFVSGGMPIIHQGTTAMNLYLVHSGSIRVQHKNHAHAVTLDTEQKSRVFGEISFFGDEPATADVLADKPCELYKISCANFQQLMREHPKLAMKLMAFVLRNMGDIIRRFDTSRD